jgi:hypothetical protein
MTRFGSFAGLLGFLALAACGGTNGKDPGGSGAGAGGSGTSGGSNGTTGGSGSGGSGTTTGGSSTGGSASTSGGTEGAGASGGSGDAGSGNAGTGNVSVGAPGVWENVTPAGISLDQQNPGGGDNYGVQDVLADPARPSDLYAFVCYQGVWRSTDYGMTWTQVNSEVNWGKPWGEAIDPNPNRDPNTPPTLYAGGSNPIGFFKSTDYGENWTVTELPTEFGDYRYQQVYSIDVNPYDVDHVLVAFHEAPDMAESTDGGATWVKHDTPGGDGSSYYPFFINTGNAETTHETWLTIPQQNGDARALRTTDGGANWTDLDQFQHHHGSAQIFDAGAGTLYVAAMSPSGIHKSTDYGVTWDMLTDKSDGVVTATPNYLYGSVGMGWGKEGDPLDPKLVTAPRDGDATWTVTPTPEGMVDGAKRMAVTFDGTHWVVVAGAWHAGIWRYVEEE